MVKLTKNRDTNHSINQTVFEMQNLSIEGNIIPHSWYQNIVTQSGKPDLPAIIILSDIVYWYRPTSVFHKDGTFKGIKQKFDSDVLQKSYDDLANKFGLSKRTVREAVIRLENIGVITREFRNIVYRGAHLSNVLYIHLNYDVLQHLTVTPMTLKCHTSNVKMSEVYTKNDHTYTDITSDTTTKITPDNNTLVHSDERTQKNDKEKELKQRFETIWKIYPNKKGKRKAFISYKAAIREGTTDDEIKEGIKAYIEECKKKRTTREFMQHGSTFFNQRRWEDDFISVQTTEEIDYEADVREFYQFKNDDDDIDYEEEWKEYLR